MEPSLVGVTAYTQSPSTATIASTTGMTSASASRSVSPRAVTRSWHSPSWQYGATVTLPPSSIHRAQSWATCDSPMP